MPIPLAVVAAAKLAPSIISALGSIIGIPPRGDLQKFQRTAYPYMRACAEQSGLPVYCYWFGDMVRVAPDGNYGVVVASTSIAAGMAKLEAMGQSFYFAECSRPDGDCVNNPASLNFVLHDSGGLLSGVTNAVKNILGIGEPSGVQQTSVLGGWTLPLLIVAGVLAWIIWGRK